MRFYGWLNYAIVDVQFIDKEFLIYWRQPFAIEVMLYNFNMFSKLDGNMFNTITVFVQFNSIHLGFIISNF